MYLSYHRYAPGTRRDPGLSHVQGVIMQLVTRADGLLYIDQAASLVRVRPKTIQAWVNRGHLERAGYGDRTGKNGRAYRVSLFRAADVRRAEAKLRPAARRIIIPPYAA
jgi:hypothetical protein